MKILYAFILNKNDGGIIHANEFINSFKKNANTISVVSSEVFSFPSFIKPANLFGKVMAKIIWLSVNLLFCSKVFFSSYKNKPEVVVFRHTPNHSTFLAQWLIKYFFPVLLEVNAINEIETKGKGHKLRVTFDHLLIARADKVFVVSEPIKKFLVQKEYCEADKVSVIVNGVDEQQFSPDNEFNDIRTQLNISPEMFVLGFIGSMKKWHGVGNIITLAKLCKIKLGDHLFVIVGDGDLKAMYEKQVIECGLEDTVKFIGRITHDQVPEYLSFMDVVLSLHYKQQDDAIEFHGSPLKMFEYMSMGKAIIASPLGQIKELISSGVDGVLLDGEDSESIATMLVRLENDREFREKLGENARNKVIENYTWKINALKVEKICKQLLLR